MRHAQLCRIHTFLASSDIHLEHKLGISRAECLRMSAEMVAFARSLCDNIEFSPEDAGRSDPAFLAELCGAVIEAGRLLPVDQMNDVGEGTYQDLPPLYVDRELRARDLRLDQEDSSWIALLQQLDSARLEGIRSSVDRSSSRLCGNSCIC